MFGNFGDSIGVVTPWLGQPVIFAASFPRGGGFYFDLVKLGLVLAVYLAWVRTCWWVDRDCAELGLPAPRWNLIMLGAGVLGLAFVWLLPLFWASFVILLALYLAPACVYVGKRNEKVSD